VIMRMRTPRKEEMWERWSKLMGFQWEETSANVISFVRKGE